MEEDNNNFKKVYETKAPEELKESSLKNAQGSVKTVKSFFDVLDLYISKFFGAIIHSFKDNSNNNFSSSLGLSQEEEDSEDGEDWYSDSDAPDNIKNN